MQRNISKRIFPLLALAVVVFLNPIQAKAVTNAQVESMIQAWENGDTSVFSSQEEYENFKWSYENGYMKTTENAENFEQKVQEIKDSGAEIKEGSVSSGSTSTAPTTESVADTTTTSTVEDQVETTPAASGGAETLTEENPVESVPDNAEANATEEPEEAAKKGRNIVTYESNFNPAVVIVILVVVVIVLTTVVASVLIFTKKPKAIRDAAEDDRCKTK